MFIYLLLHSAKSRVVSCDSEHMKRNDVFPKNLCTVLKGVKTVKKFFCYYPLNNGKSKVVYEVRTCDIKGFTCSQSMGFGLSLQLY